MSNFCTPDKRTLPFASSSSCSLLSQLEFICLFIQRAKLMQSQQKLFYKNKPKKLKTKQEKREMKNFYLSFKIQILGFDRGF